MPLSRSIGQIRPELDVITFPMQDQAGRPITASVTYEALKVTLAAAATSQPALIQHFEINRMFFEGIASRLYDRGQSSPLVTSADVKV
jgi:hypothetical protein